MKKIMKIIQPIAEFIGTVIMFLISLFLLVIMIMFTIGTWAIGVTIVINFITDLLFGVKIL